MKQYTFALACTDCYEPERLEKLNLMIEDATDITRETFMAHCGESARQVFQERLGYAAHPRQGLTAAKDWHISYHRSKWGKERCYFFKWSAIEHIFLMLALFLILTPRAHAEWITSKGRAYHVRRDCIALRTAKVVTEQNRTDAEKAGRKPCGICSRWKKRP